MGYKTSFNKFKEIQARYSLNKMKLEIINKTFWEVPYIWKLYNMLINNSRLKSILNRVSKKHQNLWDIAYSTLKEICGTKCMYYLKKKWSQIHDHSFHLKSVKNKVQMTPNVSRRKKIVKTRVKINKIGNNFKTEKI